MRELEGKVALVTGAAAGIGRAAAELFAREGAKVIVSDLDETAAEQVASGMRDQGADAWAVRADVSREEDVSALMRAIKDRFGRLDCAFNNAGIGHMPVMLTDVTLEMWNRYLAVNLTGAFLCMKHEIPLMLEQGGGAIVNMGSLAGLAATPMMGPYSASKFGLTGITKVAAAEFASRNIRVNAVCPTATDTEGMRRFIEDQNIDPARMNGPKGRMGKPIEIAEAALWLLSDRASFITGQALVANGGSAGQTV